MGWGEPILYLFLVKILLISRKHFPQSHITLNANGILILEQNDKFGETLRDTEIEITIAKYPVKVDYEMINLKIECEQVKYAYVLS